jgi:hypothetical protein
MSAVGNLFSDLQSWAAQPFTQKMDLQQWAAFTGLIIVLSIFWYLMLREVAKFL